MMNDNRLFRRSDPDFPTTPAVQARLVAAGRVDGEGPLSVPIIDAAGSIGALECLAGVGQMPSERYDFWKPFTQLPPSESLDAGVAELKRRIRSQAGGRDAGQ